MSFLDRDRVAGFWDQARKGAAEDQQTGYLQDEWPDALGHDRFRGEWRQVCGWLDRYRVGSGACLDIGCGVGLWLEHLSGRFDRADGVDLSAEMVASAQRRMERLGRTNVRVECLGIADIPADRTYDFVFVGGVLMYLNDDEVGPVLDRLVGLLRPGGFLLLRESTARTTWYRDTPLAPGLFADPAAPRPPYYAIYREPRAYRDLCERAGLRVHHWGPNRNYKLADLTEEWLRLWNRLRGGRLARDRARAEAAARRIHRLRALTLFPPYYLVRALAPRVWRLNNYWYLAERPPAQLSPAARSS